MSVSKENMLLSVSHASVAPNVHTLSQLIQALESDDSSTVCALVKKLSEEIERGQVLFVSEDSTRFFFSLGVALQHKNAIAEIAFILGMLSAKGKKFPQELLVQLSNIVNNCLDNVSIGINCSGVLSSSAQYGQVLPQNVLETLGNILVNGNGTDPGVRLNCSIALGYSAQNGQEILQVHSVQIALEKTLRDLNPRILMNTINTLDVLAKQQKSLPDVIFNTLATLIQNPVSNLDVRQRCCAILEKIAQNKQNLPEATLETLTLVLADREAELRMRVYCSWILCNVPKNGEILPKTALEVLANILSNESETNINMRLNCSLALGYSAQNGKALPQSAMEALGKTLVNANETNINMHLNCSMALCCSAKNGQKILQVASVQAALEKMLGNAHFGLFINAINTLDALVKQQKTLPDVIFSSLATLVRNPATNLGVRQRCCAIFEKIAQNKQNLPEAVLETLALILADRDTDESIRVSCAGLLSCSAQSDYVLSKAVMEVLGNILMNENETNSNLRLNCFMALCLSFEVGQKIWAVPSVLIELEKLEQDSKVDLSVRTICGRVLQQLRIHELGHDDSDISSKAVRKLALKIQNCKLSPSFSEIYLPLLEKASQHKDAIEDVCFIIMKLSEQKIELPLTLVNRLSSFIHDDEANVGLRDSCCEVLLMCSENNQKIWREKFVVKAFGWMQEHETHLSVKTLELARKALLDLEKDDGFNVVEVLCRSGKLQKQQSLNQDCLMVISSF